MRRQECLRNFVPQVDTILPSAHRGRAKILGFAPVAPAARRLLTARRGRDCASAVPKGSFETMRPIPFRGRATPTEQPVDDRSGKSAGITVVSLAAARNRLRSHTNRRPKTAAVPAELEQVDLEGLDFDRLTPGARQLYWFNLNNYARHLFASASDIAAVDSGHGYATVTTEHLREAEKKRLGAVRQREAMLGAGFILDALQILGAATCGALATRPVLTEGYGPAPLVAALAGTIAIFLVREFLYARAEA